MTAASYYAGGVRVVIAGVPMRLVRKPSKADLADMRETAKRREIVGSERYWTKPGAERKKFDADRIKADVHAYALALGIDDAAARRIIKRHAHAVELAGPIDQSLEYDL